MDPRAFTSTTYGRVVKTPGKFGFYAYLPARLPRSLALTSAAVSALSDADRALGRLAGAGRLLPNPHLLVNAYLRREAVASSRIATNLMKQLDALEIVQPLLRVSGRSNRWIARDLHQALVSPVDSGPTRS